MSLHHLKSHCCRQHCPASSPLRTSTLKTTSGKQAKAKALIRTLDSSADPTAQTKCTAGPADVISPPEASLLKAVLPSIQPVCTATPAEIRKSSFFRQYMVRVQQLGAHAVLLQLSSRYGWSPLPQAIASDGLDVG